MAVKLDKILIIDIEATCWDGKQPKDEKNEVIEFGIALLDIQSGEIEANEGILVKPTTSTVSPFCTELTTITPEMVENAISFKEACKILQEKYQSKGRMWASFGAYDYNQIMKQCQNEGISFPLNVQHLNVKALFSLKHKLKHPVGMDEALRISNLTLEGTHHRGVDDSRNIAKILVTLLDL